MVLPSRDGTSEEPVHMLPKGLMSSKNMVHTSCHAHQVAEKWGGGSDMFGEMINFNHMQDVRI